MSLRILIADDETPARRRLVELLGDCVVRCPSVVVGEAANGAEVLASAASTRPDVVLLDIHMPGPDGLEIAARLSQLDVPPAVIFVTAHDEHACRAFDLSAVDYLLKPVRAERLCQALARVGRAPKRVEPGIPKSLAVNEKGRTRLIPLDDILYLRAEQKYVTVQTEARTYLVEESLARLETAFPDELVRIHRNCLVALGRIREIGKLHGEDDGHFVRLSGLDARLVVSRRQYATLRERISFLQSTT